MLRYFMEMPPDPTEEIFAVLILLEQTCDTWTMSLPVDGHTPHSNLAT